MDWQPVVEPEKVEFPPPFDGGYYLLREADGREVVGLFLDYVNGFRDGNGDHIAATHWAYLADELSDSIVTAEPLYVFGRLSVEPE